MEGVVNLLFPFLSTPKNYDHILKKLASFAFYETYLITLALRANPRFDALFAGVESWGPIGKVTSIIPHHEVLNLFGLVVAFAVAILTHTFQFHDRVSDVLGIRRRFDLKYILVPLARLVGSVITKHEEVKIDEHRDQLMRAVFYRNASSRADNPLVDKHDIEHALNAWSWFWVWSRVSLILGWEQSLHCCSAPMISQAYLGSFRPHFLSWRSFKEHVLVDTHGHRLIA